MERTDRDPQVALLWDGRLWLAEPGSTRHAARLPPSYGEGLPSFIPAGGSLWAQCVSGPSKEPPGL